MLKKFLFVLLVLLNFNINYLYANDNTIKKSPQTEAILKLDTITVNKSVKDKIYMEITEYSNIARAREYRIPTYPKHWLVKDLPKLKNTVLWQGIVKQSENKELIISLVENDFPPLDSDEPLGSIKLILNNKNNKVNINWDNAGFKEPIQIQKVTDKQSPNHIKFKMKNKHNEYTIEFLVIINSA